MTRKAQGEDRERRDATRRSLAQRRRMARAQEGSAQASWDAALHRIEDYVRENPAKATAVAAGVGATIGIALTLALRRRR